MGWYGPAEAANRCDGAGRVVSRPEAQEPGFPAQIMNRIHRINRRVGRFALGLAASLAAHPARAELRNISAVVDVSATIFDSTTVLDSDQKTTTLGTGQAGGAVADAIRFLGTSLLADAHAAMFFADPFPPPLPDPIGEFGGELFAFTVDDTINQQVTGDVFETRTIAVTAAEVGAPDGSGVIVTGEMFFHGAIVVLSNRLGGNLTGLEALTGFEIELQRPASSPVLVQSAVLEVRGTIGNQLTVVGKGALSAFTFPVIDLSAEFPQLGKVFAILYPQIPIPFLYQVNVGEEYVLVARLRLKATTVPDYVGVGITAGGPFTHFGDGLDGFLQDGTGPALQTRLAQEFAAITPTPPQTLPLELGQDSCAPMGAEVLAMGGFVGLLSLTGFRRRVLPAGTLSIIS